MSLPLRQEMLHLAACGQVKSYATPAAVAGAAAVKWHRAQDPLSLNVSNVSSWPDRLSNGSLAQGTASLQPPYSATSFNGGPGVSGTATRWIKGTLTTAIASGTRITVYLVFQFGSDSGKTVFSLYGSPNGAYDFNNIGGVSMIVNQTCADGADPLTGPAKDTNRHLLRVTMRTTTTDKLKIDDVAYNGIRTGASAANTMTTLSLFSDNGSRIGNSTIADIFIMTGVPTAQQDTDIRTFYRHDPTCSYYGLTHTP
jgi:hypothetical protein